MEDIVYCRSEGEWFHSLEEEDPLFVIPQTATIVKDSSELYYDLTSLREVGRLDHIKQLGLASCCSDTMMGTSHTRYEHSLIFATKIDYLSQLHGLDRKLAVATGLLHDIASPPLSDSLAKAAGISDEIYFDKLVEKSAGIREVFGKHGISLESLSKLVRGEDETPLGQLVNSKGSIDIDRWSYVTNDARYASMDPKIWIGRYQPDPFRSAEIFDGRIAFKDIGEVKQFLEARIQMYERVYKSGQLAAKEAFVGELVKEMRKHVVLDADILLGMNDDDFKKMAYKHGGDRAKKIFGLDGFQVYGQLNGSESEIEAYIKSLTDSQVVVKKHKALDPAVETRIIIDGALKPYKEIEPIHANGIIYRSKAWNFATVYGYHDDADLRGAFSKAEEKFGEPDRESEVLAYLKSRKI